MNYAVLNSGGIFMIKTNRKPLETIRVYLENGMSLTDCSKICGYPISALSVMAMAWGIKLPMGRPKGCKLVAQPQP
jgi:hypothetical protein